MKLHKIKTDKSSFELIITVGLEVLENLAKFKLSRAVKTFFEFKHRKLQLLEAERQYPNQQIAFLMEVEKRFKV